MKWSRGDIEVLFIVAGLIGLLLIVIGLTALMAKSRDDSRTAISDWCEFKGGEVVEVCVETYCNGRYPRMEFWCVERIEEQPQ